MKIHTVRKGESLATIAKQHGTTIEKANLRHLTNKQHGKNLYSRHLLGFSIKTPATENHMRLLAQKLMGQSINDKDHEQNHTPTYHWTDTDIDKSINTRVARANKSTKPKAK